MISGPVIPVFFRYGIPWALGFLLLSSAGLVDAIFIGRYAGSDALAAVNLVSPMLSFFFGAGIILSVGGTVSAAKYMGEGNEEMASAMFSKSMAGLLLASFFFAACALLFTDPLLVLLGAEGSLMEPARLYLRTLMLFGPILPCAYALSQFARVDQRPRLASFGLALSACVNILLDFVLIALCDLGVFGAALASGTGFSCTLVLFLFHFLSPKVRLKLGRPHGGWLELFRAGANGGAEFINEISIGMVMLFLNRLMIARFGADGVAAFTVVNYGSWFGLTMAYGLSDTLAPLVSANYGARLKERVHSLLRTSLLTLFALGFCMFLLFTLQPERIIELFVPGNRHVASIALDFIGDYRWSFLFSGLNMGLVCYATGLHRPGQATSLALMRSLVLPLVMLAILPAFFAERGIYMAIPIAEALTLTFGAVLLVHGRRSSGW